jgi:hypothetical protein
MYGGGYQQGQLQQLLRALHSTDAPPGWEHGGHYHILLTSESIDTPRPTYKKTPESGIKNLILQALVKGSVDPCDLYSDSFDSVS